VKRARWPNVWVLSVAKIHEDTTAWENEKNDI
jgi:hypothetical protein